MLETRGVVKEKSKECARGGTNLGDFWRQMNLAAGENLEIFLPELVLLKQNFCHENSMIFCQVTFSEETKAADKQIRCVLCLLWLKLGSVDRMGVSWQITRRQNNIWICLWKKCVFMPQFWKVKWTLWPRWPILDIPPLETAWVATIFSHWRRWR